MTEIEQLRADIEKLENAMPIAKRLGAQATCATLGALKSEIEFELAKLEAEKDAKADPWKEAKALLDYSKDSPENLTIQFLVVADYARHLEQRVAELEKQLAGEKQQVHNVESVVYVLSNDLKKAQDRIAELEAELAKRPVVWCAKFKSGEMVKQTSRDASRCYREHTALYRCQSLAKGMHPDLQIEPYTGEQS